MTPVSHRTAADAQSSFFQLIQPANPHGNWAIAYTDGGSRGNPGPSGYGVVILGEDGTVLGELSEFLGMRTNNVAEYSGLLAALEFALAKGHPRLRVVSDSELMVKQIRGQYRVQSPDLRPLYEEAKRRIAQLEEFQIEHVLRGKNKKADELANHAMDRGMRRKPEVKAAVSPLRTGCNRCRAAGATAARHRERRKNQPAGRIDSRRNHRGGDAGKGAGSKSGETLVGFDRHGYLRWSNSTLCTSQCGFDLFADQLAVGAQSGGLKFGLHRLHHAAHIAWSWPWPAADISAMTASTLLRMSASDADLGR